MVIHYVSTVFIGLLSNHWIGGWVAPTEVLDVVV